MFASDRQLSQAIIALLSTAPALTSSWTPNGPTDEALELYETGGGLLSSGERALLLAAFALWNKDNQKLSFAGLWNALSGRPLQALLTLLLAADAGGEDVEQWLAKWRTPPRLSAI